jgi:hypothetical protein
MPRVQVWLSRANISRYPEWFDASNLANKIVEHVFDKLHLVEKLHWTTVLRRETSTNLHIMSKLQSMD